MKNYSRTKTLGEGSVDQWPGGQLNDHEEHDYDHHLRNKSVLSKVKDKAMIWKRTVKKQSYNDASTPEWGVSLQDEYDDDEDPDQYFGAPAKHCDQSELLAPEKIVKEIATSSRQHPGSIPVVYKRHIRENRSSSTPLVREEEKETPTKTLTRSVTEKLVAPAYAVVSGAQMIASMLQDVVVSSTSAASAAWEGTSSSFQQIIMDKGVTAVKEKEINVVEELGNGDEERTVSDHNEMTSSDATNIPTKTPTLNRGTDDTGVREKARETPSASMKKSANVSTSSVTMSAQRVAGDENHKRTLQPN